MENPIRKAGKYAGDVVEELRKCTWPTKQELVQMTGNVIVSCLLLALFVFAADQIFVWLISKI